MYVLFMVKGAQNFENHIQFSWDTQIYPSIISKRLVAALVASPCLGASLLFSPRTTVPAA